MDNLRPVHVAVIGSGAISDIYLQNMINRFDILQVDAICANHFENAQKKAEKYGIRACTYEEILTDKSIEMVVNLTPNCVHYELIKKALLAGKHVYTEKTLTDDLENAKELLAIADEKNLYLGSAPDTFMGAAFQTAREIIDSGRIGDIHSFAAAANRDNDLLLSMFSFLRMPGGGVCFDYAVYYMTVLISLLGAVDRVAAIVRTPYPTHKNIVPQHPEYGKMMDTPNESQVYAILQLENGIGGTFHLNADTVMDDQAFIAIYGTKGILYLPDPNQFGGKIKLLPKSEYPDFSHPTQKEEIPVTFGFADNSRGIGPAEMAYAIRQGRKNRASKELAYHVMEVLDAMLRSGKTGTFEKINSTCEKPEPLKKAEREEDSIII